MDYIFPDQQLAAAMGERWNALNQRLYNLDSIPNARDLGGLPAAGGRRIRRGCLLRSGVLTYGSDNDIAFLHDQLHIGVVIDLRTAYEVGKVPDRPVPGATYVNMPISDNNNNIWMEMAKHPGSEPEKLRSFAQTDISKVMTQRMYTGFVMDEFCQLQYAAFIQRLLNEHSDKNVLWHCSQGKDRTGLIAAFLLFTLGCSRQTVIDDFSLTNIYYCDVIDEALRQLRTISSSPDDASVIESLLGVRTDYFVAALDLIDQQYGSMDNYLSQVLLISDADRARLQNIYLE